MTENPYSDRAALDHDADLLLEGILSDLDARGVDRAAALASIRRVLKGRA